MAVVFLWLLLVFAVGSVTPARIEADESQGTASASTWELVGQLAVLCGAALGSLHFLSRNKARFRAGWW